VLADISEQKQIEQDSHALDVKLKRAKKRPRVDPKPGRGKGGAK
jgi:hypothetical protein